MRCPDTDPLLLTAWVTCQLSDLEYALFGLVVDQDRARSPIRHELDAIQRQLDTIWSRLGQPGDSPGRLAHIPSHDLDTQPLLLSGARADRCSWERLSAV